MGSGTLFYGSQGVKKNIIKNNKKSSTSSHYKSQSYTTNWNELLKVT